MKAKRDRGAWAAIGADGLGRACQGGEQLVARKRHGLRCALLVDQVLVGRLFADLHESGVVVRDDLVGIPLAPVLGAEHLDAAAFVHAAESATGRDARHDRLVRFMRQGAQLRCARGRVIERGEQRTDIFIVGVVEGSRR
jgi:hypothetical protein